MARFEFQHECLALRIIRNLDGGRITSVVTEWSSDYVLLGGLPVAPATAGGLRYLVRSPRYGHAGGMSSDPIPPDLVPHEVEPPKGSLASRGYRVGSVQDYVTALLTLLLFALSFVATLWVMVRFKISDGVTEVVVLVLPGVVCLFCWVWIRRRQDRGHWL
jgi:hypothetical protein